MEIAHAFYSDGRTAARQAVRAYADARGLTILDTAGRVVDRWPWESLAMAGHRRGDGGGAFTRLPDRRERLTVADPAFVAAVLARRPRLARNAGSVSRGGAVLAIGTAVLAVAAFLGFDRAAPLVARLIPASVERQIGEAAIAQMTFLFAENGGGRCTGQPGRAALEGLAARLGKAAGAADVQVEVIPSSVANAFAVPGDRIVILSGLFELAGTGDALAGVLAHEMGHVALAHPATGLVRSEAIGLAKLVFLGNAGLSGNMGEMLVQFAYTRDMETEADRQAIAILRAAGLRTGGLADFFATIEAEEGGGELPAIMSTHPATAERRAMVASSGDEGSESIGREAWEAIKTMCPKADP